jgi:AcrR family transcriptional regulator
MPTTSSPRRRAAPRPYHHGDLRAALLDAAQAWLDARGLETLTLREIAKAAGVSHAAPYHHFAGLDGLLAGVAARGFARLADAMARAPARARTSADALLDIGEAYVRDALAHPAQFRLMFGPLLARRAEFPDFDREAARAFAILLETATVHAPEGGLELALACWSLAHGAANLAIDGALHDLPIPRAQAAALRRADPAVLLRRMAEPMLAQASRPARRAARS